MPCSRAERLEVPDPGHGAVLVHHLADHPGGVEAGQPGQVHRRLGLAGALEHAAGDRAQREHVPGPGQVLGARLGIDGGEDGLGAVGGGDAGGGAALGLDGHAERGAETGGVLLVLDHQGNAQLVEPLPGHREADEAAPVAGHEVDDLGRDLLGGDGEVALVLAVLVVDDDQHLAGLEVLEGVGNGAERHSGVPQRARDCDPTGRGRPGAAPRTWRSRPPRGSPACPGVRPAGSSSPEYTG